MRNRSIAPSPWQRAGAARCQSVCPHRHPEAQAAGRAPATPWPLCGAPGGTDWSARSRWRDAPLYCTYKLKRGGVKIMNCSNFYVCFWPSCSPEVLSHPLLPVLDARLCSVPFCLSWLFMMASCLCFKSVSLALNSSSTHTSEKPPKAKVWWLTVSHEQS